MKRILLLFTLALASISCSTDKDEQLFEDNNKKVFGDRMHQYEVLNNTNSDILVRLIALPKFVTQDISDLNNNFDDPNLILAHLGLVNGNVELETYLEIPAGTNFSTNFWNGNAPEENDNELNDALFGYFLYHQIDTKPIYNKYNNELAYWGSSMYKHYKIYFAEFAVKDSNGQYDLSNMSKFSLKDDYLFSLPIYFSDLNNTLSSSYVNYEFDTYIPAEIIPNIDAPHNIVGSIGKPKIAYYKRNDYPHENEYIDNNGNPIYGSYTRNNGIADPYVLQFNY